MGRMMTFILSSGNVVALLENNWKNIQEQLGDDWNDFSEAYIEIINKLPDKSNIKDIETTTDQICRELHKYDFTKELMQSLQGEQTEKLLNSPNKTLNESESVFQIRNRMKNLVIIMRPVDIIQNGKENLESDTK